MDNTTNWIAPTPKPLTLAVADVLFGAGTSVAAGMLLT